MSTNNRVLSGLLPERVFWYFEELSRIPRGSGHTKAAGDWVAAFAQEHGLPFRQDEAGNVMIWKPAHSGYESRPTVMLQGHLDMVCVQDPGTDHDFLHEPLSLIMENGFVKAQGTTLGADNGIAIAMMLAVLEDSTIPHPPLEALFTADEEIGMLGAAAWQPEGVASQYLLNLDSEGEGILTAGCAGGVRCQMERVMPTAAVEGTVCTLTLKGLAGGHSGGMIHLGLGNASRLLAQCLEELGCPPLVSLRGGNQDNAIPNAATAVIVLPAGTVEDARKKAEDWNARTKPLYPRDKGWTFTFMLTDVPANAPANALTNTAANNSAVALSLEDSRRTVAAINALPDGVQAMDAHLPGQVETSLNMGIASLEDGQLRLATLLRSSSASALAALQKKVEDIAGRFGLSVTASGSYPPWEYRPESRLREVMVKLGAARFGREPVVETIHGGLECGVLANKVPGLDAISFGPNMYDIHTPRERLDIASVGRTWDYLLDALKTL